MSARTGSAGPGRTWVVVDVARILWLPEELKRLWPPELLPGTRIAEAGPGGATGDPGTGPPVPTAGASSAPAVARSEGTRAEAVRSPVAGGRRDADVLTAWLRGFAGELGGSLARLTVVISSGEQTVHLAVAITDECCLAILRLEGGGRADFTGFEFLRRLDTADLGVVVDGLSGLVEADCVLTLASMSAAGDSALEFLHRVDGGWRRPRLQRTAEGLSAAEEVEAGEDAVRTLVVAVLTRLLEASAPGPAGRRPAARSQRSRSRAEGRRPW